MRIWTLYVLGTCLFLMGCAHLRNASETAMEAARLDPVLVRETVVFESGTKDGAIVPEISAPRLRAVWVPERLEGNRLIEAHREWFLEGDVTILGIPRAAKSGAARKQESTRED